MVDELDGLKKVRKNLYEENPDVPSEYVMVPRSEGWNLTFGTEESLDFWKYKQNRRINELIPQEFEKPKEERFKPPDPYNPLSLDLLSTGEYAFAAGMRKWAYPESSFKKTFSEKESFIDVYTSVEQDTLNQIQSGEMGYYNPYTKKWGLNASEIESTRTGLEAYRTDPASRFGSSIIFDPVSYLTATATGARVFINGKSVQLTKDGAKLLATMYVGVDPKKHRLVQLTFSNMLKTNPALYSKAIQNTGLRVVWTNLEVVPRQFLPWTWIVPTGKKVINAGKSSWDVVASAFSRKYIGILSKLPRTAPLPPPPTFNQMRALNAMDIVTAKKAAADTVQELVDLSKKQAGNYVNARYLLTELIENPALLKNLPELSPIVSKWEAIRSRMASVEKAEGILKSEQMNYIRHYLTFVAKQKMGIVGGDVKAPFSFARKMKGTVSQINYQSQIKDGFKLLNDDAFFLMTKRMQEHEQAIGTVNLIKSAGQQFGKAAKEVAGDKNYVPSSFPQLKGTYLPKEIEDALIADKNVGQVMALMGQRTKYEAAKDVIKLPFQKAYEFQKWSLHTWEVLQTRYFPAFYAVNFYGGKFMAWLGGSADLADDAAAITAMRKSMPDNTKIVTNEITGKIYYKDEINKYAEEYGMKRVGMAGVKVGEKEAGLTDGIVKIGWAMEEELRLSMFLNRLKIGDSPKDAAAYVLKYQFDYTQEYKGVEKILSDFIPFFTWQKNALPFFAQMTFESYGKMGAFGKLAQATWGSPEAEVTQPYLQDWTTTRPTFYLGGDRNEAASLNLPMGIWGDTFRKFSSPSNATQAFGPVPQIANKWITGVDPYTGKNISSSEAVTNTMFGRWISTINKVKNPDIPFWEKTTELMTGTQIIQLNDQMAYAGILDQTGERMVTNALHRLGGRAHGCGF